jgi:2-polyprenyl-3-methyl-5-hydroxy-6-metoxy-1,4-benzoquinol methylase
MKRFNISTLKKRFATAETMIQFHSRQKFHQAYSCPACGRAAQQKYLSIKEVDSELVVLKCTCGTIFYPGAVAPDYELVESTDSFYMRIDQAEGIDSALAPMFSSPDLNRLPVIDIGCGMGFTSDFVRFQGRKCVAFDPSSAALMSTKHLGIEIFHEYATIENTESIAESLVFASEVIEHVENPSDFMMSLKKFAGSKGYLIVTTPNADFVTRRNSINTILAMLAPSQHIFLLSDKSLASLAMQAGFKFVKTWTINERLFLIAGPAKLELKNTFPRGQYIDYLDSKLGDAKIEQALRVRAFGYRLFKEYVNIAKYSEAVEVLKQISQTYSQLNFNLAQPEEVAEMYNQEASRLGRLPNPETFPFNMPILLYLIGILHVAYYHDKIVAKPYFLAAIKLSGIYREVFSHGTFQAYDLEIQEVANWSEKAIAVHEL